MLNRAARKVRPDSLVFAPHFVFSWMRRKLNAHLTQEVDSHGDGAIELNELRTSAQVQVRDRRTLNCIRCPARESGQALIRGCQFAGQKLAFGPLQLQGEEQVASSLPPIT